MRIVNSTCVVTCWCQAWTDCWRGTSTRRGTLVPVRNCSAWTTVTCSSTSPMTVCRRTPVTMASTSRPTNSPSQNCRPTSSNPTPLSLSIRSRLRCTISLALHCKVSTTPIYITKRSSISSFSALILCLMTNLNYILLKSMLILILMYIAMFRIRLSLLCSPIFLK